MEVLSLTFAILLLCVSFWINIKRVQTIALHNEKLALDILGVLDVILHRQDLAAEQAAELNRSFCDLEDFIEEDTKNRSKAKPETENLFNLRKAFTTQRTDINGRS